MNVKDIYCLTLEIKIYLDLTRRTFRKRTIVEGRDNCKFRHSWASLEEQALSRSEVVSLAFISVSRGKVITKVIFVVFRYDFLILH